MIDEKYAFVNRSYLASMFYAPLFPYGVLFEIIGLIIFYNLNKYLLLRRSAFPNSISNRISSSMVRITFFGPMLFSCSNLLYDKVLSIDIS